MTTTLSHHPDPSLHNLRRELAKLQSLDLSEIEQHTRRVLDSVSKETALSVVRGLVPHRPEFAFVVGQIFGEEELVRRAAEDILVHPHHAYVSLSGRAKEAIARTSLVPQYYTEVLWEEELEQDRLRRQKNGTSHP